MIMRAWDVPRLQFRRPEHVVKLAKGEVADFYESDSVGMNGEI